MIPNRQQHFASSKSSDNTQDWKQRIMLCFSKLKSRSSQKIASEQLENEIEDLTGTKLPNLLVEVCVTDSVAQSKEAYKLLAITAAVHKEGLDPYLKKIIAAIIKTLKLPTGGNTIREYCAEAIGIIAMNVCPQKGSSQESPMVAYYYKPLLALLNDVDKGVQSGALMCITSTIGNNLDYISKDATWLATKLIEKSGLSSTPVQSQGGIMTALAKLIEVSKESITSTISHKIASIALGQAKSSDWQVRKASIVLMHTFMMLIDPKDKIPSQDAMFKTLKELKYDRTPPVRDSATSALKSLHDAGIDPLVTDPGADGKLKRNTVDTSQPPMSKVAGNFTFIPLSVSTGHGVISPIRAAVESRTPKKFPKIENAENVKNDDNELLDDDYDDVGEKQSEFDQDAQMISSEPQDKQSGLSFRNNFLGDSKSNSFVDLSDSSAAMSARDSVTDREIIQRLNALEKQQSEMFFLFRQKTERMELMIGEMKDSISRMETLLSAVSSRIINPVPSPKQTNSWDKALGLLSEERVDEAFRCVLESHDPQTLFRLMDISGPSNQSLNNDTLYELFNQALPYMKDDSLCPILFSWIEQLISLGIVLPEQTMSALETSLGQKSSVPSSTGERAKRILSTLNQ